MNFFEFYRYEDAIKLTTDPTFDQAKFDSYLETKGSSDHRKLIEMLEKLNDESQSMELILEKYFDVENITYWLAFQLMTGNIDTLSRNMYLYSPQNSDTWYILDWDNDSMLGRTEYEIKGFSEGKSWQSGISNYWSNTLFRRALQSQSFREELEKAVQNIRAFMNEERIETMVAHYRSIVEQYIWKMPDVLNLPITKDEYNLIAENIPEEIEDNYRRYNESYKYPMPFFIGTPSIQNGVLQLNWDPSYDFNAEDITYTVELARDYQFRQVLYRQEHVVLPVVQAEAPGAGQYFIRVRATNASGYTQDAFDYYVIDTGKVYGVKCFYIQPDGSIVEDTYEE